MRRAGRFSAVLGALSVLAGGVPPARGQVARAASRAPALKLKRRDPEREAAAEAKRERRRARNLHAVAFGGARGGAS